MRYICNTDYNPIIQAGQLEYQLTQNNIQTLLKCELIAQSEVESLLSGKYDLSSEFTNTGTWSYGATYGAASRIILDYATFSSTKTYHIGDCVIIPNDSTYDNTSYSPFGEAYCLTGTSSLGPTSSFNTNLWTDLGPQYSISYITYPAPLFNYLLDYQKGDIVFWQGQTWSCATTTPVISQQLAEQYITINAVPRNVIPTDLANKNYNWWIPSNIPFSTPTVGMTYSVGTMSIGTYSIIDTLPINPNFWTNGDNRSQLMILHYIEIVLYYLHMNIQPTNVPEFRKIGYKQAIDYLKDIIEGRKNSPILLLQPSQGDTVRFGGNVQKSIIW